MKIFDEHYDNNGFDKSQYNDFSKKHLVIEAEYMHDALWSILKYLNSGGFIGYVKI